MTAVADCQGRFVWHDLMTSDVEAAEAFYTALLPEWTIKSLTRDDGSTYRMIHANGYDLGGILPLAGGQEVPSHWIGYVAVADCDATVAKFESLGGACCVPARDFADVGRYAVVADPQGATIKPFQLANEVKLPEMPGPGHFCWDELMANDIEAARKVYCDAFGWQTNEVDMGPSGKYTVFKAGEREVGGGMKTPGECESPPMWLSYVLVDDVDARAAKAKQLGAQTYVEPQEIPGIGRFSAHADPTGAAFALFTITMPMET